MTLKFKGRCPTAGHIIIGIEGNERADDTPAKQANERLDPRNHYTYTTSKEKPETS